MSIRSFSVTYPGMLTNKHKYVNIVTITSNKHNEEAAGTLDTFIMMTREVVDDNPTIAKKMILGGISVFLAAIPASVAVGNIADTHERTARTYMSGADYYRDFDSTDAKMLEDGAKEHENIAAAYNIASQALKGTGSFGSTVALGGTFLLIDRRRRLRAVSDEESSESPLKDDNQA